MIDPIGRVPHRVVRKASYASIGTLTFSVRSTNRLPSLAVIAGPAVFLTYRNRKSGPHTFRSERKKGWQLGAGATILRSLNNVAILAVLVPQLGSKSWADQPKPQTTISQWRKLALKPP
jgi:hypothetical protein